jgi:hypothetical protein
MLANHFEMIGIGKDGDNYFIFAKSNIAEMCYLTEGGEFTFNKKLRGEIDSFETIKEIFIDMYSDSKSMEELNLMFAF